jgi:hypothetical protein
LIGGVVRERCPVGGENAGASFAPSADPVEASFRSSELTGAAIGNGAVFDGACVELAILRDNRGRASWIGVTGRPGLGSIPA